MERKSIPASLARNLVAFLAETTVPDARLALKESLLNELRAYDALPSIHCPPQRLLLALEQIKTAGSGDHGPGSHQRKAALIRAMKNIAAEAILVSQPY